MRETMICRAIRLPSDRALRISSRSPGVSTPSAAASVASRRSSSELWPVASISSTRPSPKSRVIAELRQRCDGFYGILSPAQPFDLARPNGNQRILGRHEKRVEQNENRRQRQREPKRHRPDYRGFPLAIVPRERAAQSTDREA